MTYEILKYLHVIGATLILGTGIGIAFFMLMAHRTRDAAFIARIAGTVVFADFLFTATAVIMQPLTGYFLMRQTGVSVFDGWIGLSLILYVVVGVFWLPAVENNNGTIVGKVRHRGIGSVLVRRALHRCVRLKALVTAIITVGLGERNVKEIAVNLEAIGRPKSRE